LREDNAHVHAIAAGRAARRAEGRPEMREKLNCTAEGVSVLWRRCRPAAGAAINTKNVVIAPRSTGSAAYIG